MKNYKKIIICFFVACMVFLLNVEKVYGLYYAGEAAALGYTSCKSNCGGHGFAACNWEEQTQTSDAGLLISIISYDAGSNKETVLKSKYLVTSRSMWGSYTQRVTKQCITARNTTDSCGNSESVDDVERTKISVRWGKPGKSNAIKNADGELAVSGLLSPPSFTGGGLKSYIENYLLVDVFTGNTLKTSIDSINKLMFNGQNVLKYSEYTKYYIKVEPIYRVFPAISNKTPCANCTTSSSAVAVEKTNDCGHTYSYDSCKAKDSSGNCPSNYSVTEGHCTSDSTKPCYKNSEGNCTIKWNYKEITTEYGINRDDLGRVSDASFTNSYLTTARESNSFSAYMRALFVSEANNSQPVVTTEATTKTGVDYFVGYHYQNAIAMGSSGVHKYNAKSNIYKLLTNIDNAKIEYSGNNKTTVGMAIYSLQDRPKEKCVDVCEKYDKNHANDEYLKCASNYCDGKVQLNETTSGTIDKRHCILDTDKCDYRPAKPIDCSNNDIGYVESVSTKNGGHAEEGYTKQVSSTCGFTDSTKTKSIDEKSGAYQFCARQGNDIIEARNDGKYVYDYQDSNTYINISCMESATAIFKDLSNVVLRPSKSINYGGTITANRECQVFFDTVSWKLDFASTHANDTTRKMMMLEKVNAFNAEANSLKEADTVNGSEEFQRQGKAIVGPDKNKMTLNDLEGGDQIAKVKDLRITNDDAKTSVKTIVEEVVENKKSTKGMEAYGGEITLERVNKDKNNNISISSSTNPGKDQLTLVLGFDETNKKNKSNIDSTSKKANRYIFTSGIKNEYEIPDVCIRDDGSAKVELLSKGKTECNSYISNNSYSAKRNYYISALATANRKITDPSLKHQFITTATVKINKFQGTLDTSYFVENETCEYKVDDGTAAPGIYYDMPEIGLPNGFCTSIATTDSTVARLYYSNVDLPEGVTIKKHGIKEITGEESGKSEPNGADYIELTAKPITITESHGEIITKNETRRIEAVIEDSEGNKYYSQDTISLTGSPTGACKIDISHDPKVKVTASTNTIYYATSNNRKGDGSLVWTKVKKSSQGFVINNYTNGQGIYVAIRNGSKLELCAEYTSNVKCTDCHTDITDKGDNKKVRDYCHDYWDTDKNNPKDEQACFEICKSSCPTTCDSNAIKTWCTKNWSEEGYKSQAECESECGCVREGKVTYRPINEYNPFPYSETSDVLGYTKGDRLIGKNWYKKEHLITDNASQNYTDKPLYEVDLSITDIAAIRNDTKMYYDRDIDPYMSRQTYSQSSRCLLPDANGYIYKGYCSALIHDSSISNKFTKVRGV